jgi:solute carrier family 25 (mitochondrial aspartate/glutamate transporter), member 12/13
MSATLAFGSKLAAGAVAGIIGVSCTFPLDFAKTRLQKQSTREYTGMIDCLRKVARAKGFTHLYSGLRPNLAGIIPEKAIKLACADQFREILRDKSTGQVSLLSELLAGGGAGFCQVVVTTPMEIVKIRCQLTGSSMLSVVRELGIRGMYQGYVPTLARDVWFSVLFFPLQAKMKEAMAQPDDTPAQRTAKSFLAGITAGATASGLSTPIDVIKTRIQASDSGSMRSVLSATIATEGYGALWKGLVPRMIAIAPLFGIAIMVYDFQKRILRSMGYYVPE